MGENLLIYNSSILATGKQFLFFFQCIGTELAVERNFLRTVAKYPDTILI